MQINGQDIQGSQARWSIRLRKSLQTYGDQPKAWPVVLRPGQDKKTVVNSSKHAVKANHLLSPSFERIYFKPQSIVFLGIVLLMHAAALYLLTRVTDIKMPAVSVPLMISFVLSEPVQEKPKVKPRPRPQALADEPLTNEKPPDEAQPQVIPPQFDVAHLNNPPPDYPPLSRRLREQGEVLLRVYVMPDGIAGQVQIHTSSGYSRLDRAAKEAVERWKFVPAQQGDAPVGAWVLVPIQYILKS